jgi:hypothetical protein
MLLMDAISRAAGTGSLRYVFSDITERMQLTPRYLLDDSVVQASTEIGLSRPSVLREAMRHLRIPYPRLWVEWPETGRSTLRQRLAVKTNDPLKPIPERLGFLLESDGRRGRVSWAWALPPHPGYPVDVCLSPYDASLRSRRRHPAGFRPRRSDGAGFPGTSMGGRSGRGRSLYGASGARRITGPARGAAGY